jgi:hypothetical protein
VPCELRIDVTSLNPAEAAVVYCGIVSFASSLCATFVSLLLIRLLFARLSVTASSSSFLAQPQITKPCPASPQRYAMVSYDVPRQGAQKPLTNQAEGNSDDVFVGSVDNGTTSSRFLIFDTKGNPVASHQVEFKQMYPHPGYGSIFWSKLAHIQC